jgi:hypothetical protein
MKSFKHLVLPALLLCAAASGAAAQQVYRCGNSYSQTPCTGAVAVPTDDARTDEQRAAARQALASDKALAKDLETSRRKDEAMALAREKALASSAAVHKKPEAKKAGEPKAKKKTAGTRTAKVKEPEFFTATDGATNSKKKTSSKAGKS